MMNTYVGKRSNCSNRFLVIVNSNGQMQNTNCNRSHKLAHSQREDLAFSPEVHRGIGIHRRIKR